MVHKLFYDIYWLANSYLNLRYLVCGFMSLLVCSVVLNCIAFVFLLVVSSLDLDDFLPSLCILFFSDNFFLDNNNNNNINVQSILHVKGDCLGNLWVCSLFAISNLILVLERLLETTQSLIKDDQFTWFINVMHWKQLQINTLLLCLTIHFSDIMFSGYVFEILSS